MSRTTIICAAALLLISASDGEPRSGADCSDMIEEKRIQKNKLLTSLEKYRYCVWEQQNSTICMPNYDEMSAIYSEYRDSSVTYNSRCGTSDY